MRLRSSVVYQLICPGCNASYVGQTVRHLSTRMYEHQRSSAPVTQHLSQCSPNTAFPEPQILDFARSDSKLLTLEALYIQKFRPALNQRDEYRRRQLTLKF